MLTVFYPELFKYLEVRNPRRTWKVEDVEEEVVEREEGIFNYKCSFKRIISEVIVQISA